MVKKTLTPILIGCLTGCASSTPNADAWYESAHASCEYQHQSQFEALAACNISAWLTYGEKLGMDVRSVREGGEKACNALYRNIPDLIPSCLEMVNQRAMAHADKIEQKRAQQKQKSQTRHNALIMRCAAEGGRPDFVSGACI